MSNFLKRLKISGLRGFSIPQSLKLVIPDGKTPGSGLTIITGPNNSGKSTIIEALRANSSNRAPSFHIGMRNQSAAGVKIEYFFEEHEEVLSSIRLESSEAVWKGQEGDRNIFVLPSRRSFNPFFGKNKMLRQQYIANTGGLPAQRTAMLSRFETRLFAVASDPRKFNKILRQVVPDCPEWTIEQAETGQYFLKFPAGDSYHSSDGVGEGIVSVICIIDSLYDSDPGEIIVIDEPELSLHPSVQKRLLEILEFYAKDRQIIIATHSPYFVRPEAICKGATLARVWNRGEGIEIHQVIQRTRNSIEKLSKNNLNNPHILGLDARELFFLDDGVILLEGQEDVVFYPLVQGQIGIELIGELFGWGVGGASNMVHLCRITSDLGFRKVVCVLDADQADRIPALQQHFPDFLFKAIAANDVRTKPKRAGTEEKIGLLDADRKIREEYREDTVRLFQDINDHLSPTPP